MANFVSKIICPNPEHQEFTASCAVYDDGSAYCFGCQRYFSSVGPKSFVSPEPEVKISREEILKTVNGIETNSIQKRVRGLDLFTNSEGYYIIWPKKDYYKLRRWTAESGQSKYLNPKGATIPPYFLKALIPAKTLLCVEGELNALSSKKACPEIDILGLSGAAQFSSSSTQNFIDTLSSYDTIIIVADNDLVGAKAALKLKDLLKKKSHFVKIKLVELDYNDELVINGEETLRQRIQELL